MSSREFIVSVPAIKGMKAAAARQAIRDAVRATGDFYGQKVDVVPVPTRAASVHAELEHLPGDFWAVVAPCGEGVVFRNPIDARWALTGTGTGSDGFGHPTIAEHFRDCYGGECLVLLSLRLGSVASEDSDLRRDAARWRHGEKHGFPTEWQQVSPVELPPHWIAEGIDSEYPTVGEAIDAHMAALAAKGGAA
ncbi:hypothetical protein KW843_07605 [Acidovorax sp. sif1233]|uniref:hypothetical protein n=1 Tax=Acidovorax sp. sif1233 TaxID=2854792 RepID=UPI001C4948B5|nr:hypothetical protein [Acidovorax sp. sif1233]MBV7454332.1 hypothetical protein [Acidovorax sp. sif1233]